ncbi:hypothetical protein LP43_0472 [Methylophaga thiooxydans]|uniref:Lipoprotein n=1 Tax=Methylophaga thiooxydans TaxID=392484 RepID=A0A0A0BLT0_9GAMM|nr:hypothetical protein [Methylophaga thiooxydans]KGM08049.1 hypothetical protein LP43_0472 [Methylophaga thiooxydans]
MLNHIRLMFIAFFMGLFLVACGDDSSTQDTAEEAAPMASEEMAPAAEEPAVAEETSSIDGMTEEEAVAKWGEPDVTQTRTIDALTITHHEWHGEDGITSVQFHNGVAKFSQNIPAK